MFYKNFAADYNCAAYGAGAYDSNQSCATITGSGSLADTGTNVTIGITGGILLVVVAIAMLVATRRKAKRANQAND